MKRIHQSPDGTWHLAAYQEYLNEERKGLALLVLGDDLLDHSRMSLDDRGSLHDARLRRIALEVGARDAPGRAEILLEGAYYDRAFRLTYEDVTRWELSVPGPETDLLVHEVWTEDGFVNHELVFDKGNVLRIVCRKVHFAEEIHEASGGLEDSE